MDVTKLLETGVNVELVRSSPSKKLVILSGGAMKQMPDGKEKLSLSVEIDGKALMWTPNRTTMKNIAKAHGNDSNNWLSKHISLEIGTLNGREAVVGKPIDMPIQPTSQS